MQFNEKLKQLRARKGISQTELAQKIYVSRSAVAKWENGLGLPSEQSLDMLAAFFGIPVSELLSDPTAETVIVTQNNQLSKQKILISVLSCILLLAIATALVFTVLYARNQSVNTEFEYVRELIFETERETDTALLKNYGDGEISADRTFAESRTFEIPQGTGGLHLPKLLLKITENKKVTYKDIDYANIVFTCSDEILARTEDNDIVVLTADYYTAQCTGWVNIKYGELYVSVKIERHKTDVRSVSIRLDDNSNSIGLAQKKLLQTEILPYDANDQTCEIRIEKIVLPDTTDYTGDSSDFAKIENHYLTISKTAEIGARLYLSATAVDNGVKSSVLTVEIVRIPIESFHLRLKHDANYITIGTSLQITQSARPSDATFNILGEKATLTLLTPEVATLQQTERGWILTATNDRSAVGKSVSIVARTDEITKIFTWSVTGIPIQSMIVLNSDSNTELEDICSLSENDVLRLSVKIFPDNAVYDAINFIAWTEENRYAKYFSMSPEGELTIAQGAPENLKIYVCAVADGKLYSKIYTVVVR